MAKPKISTDWMCGCAGCHMSLAGYGRAHPAPVLELADLRSTPITDLKDPDEKRCGCGHPRRRHAITLPTIEVARKCRQRTAKSWWRWATAPCLAACRPCAISSPSKNHCAAPTSKPRAPIPVARSRMIPSWPSMTTKHAPSMIWYRWITTFLDAPRMRISSFTFSANWRKGASRNLPNDLSCSGIRSTEWLHKKLRLNPLPASKGMPK
jgi:hypothetical protein